MQDITFSITQTSEYRQLYDGLRAGLTPAMAVGLPPVVKAQLAAALHLETGRPVLLLTDDEGAARRLAEDMALFAGKNVLRVPERDFVMLGVESSSRQYEQARIAALWQLLDGVPLAAGSAAALSQACIPPQTLKAASFSLSEGGEQAARGHHFRARRCGLPALRTGGRPGPVFGARRHSRPVPAARGRACARRVLGG